MNLLLNRRGALNLALIAVLAGCGGGSDPPPSNIGGTWSQPGTVPGSSLTFTLAAQGTNVTGTGTVSVEAGFQGTVNVSGTVQGNSVVLTIQYSNGFILNFDGALVSPSTMQGTFTSTQGSASGQLVKE